MKKSLALIAALLSLSGFAAETLHTWFDMDINSMGKEGSEWPTDGSDYKSTNCSVTNTAVATYANNLLSIADGCLLVANTIVNAPINDATYVEACIKARFTVANALPPMPAGVNLSAIAYASGTETNYWVSIGDDKLVWTDTGIPVDMAAISEMKIFVSNGVEGACTEWKVGEQVFRRNVTRVPSLDGVVLFGAAEVSDCWGRMWNVGTCFTFKLSDVSSNVTVVVTNAMGSVVNYGKDSLGRDGYTYYKDAVLGLSFTAPSGYVFRNGLTEMTAPYTNDVDGAAYTPFDGMGIWEIDFGPANGWNVAYGQSGAVSHHADLDGALAAMKDVSVLEPCYSETEHTIEYAPTGIVVDGDSYPVKEHYHYKKYIDTYEDHGEICTNESWALEIKPEEAVITSFGTNSTDATKVSVGSIEKSVVGFNYSVMYGPDPAFTNDVQETDSVAGNDSKLELAAPKSGDKCFYRIKVTD